MTTERTPAQHVRRTYLIAVFVGWCVVDILDGAVFADEAVEHWVEAVFLALAALGYLVLARLRPPAPEHRLADWVIPGGVAVFGVAMGLRASLPDDTAFLWALGVIAAYTVVVSLTVRRMRGTGVPANEPPAS